MHVAIQHTLSKFTEPSMPTQNLEETDHSNQKYLKLTIFHKFEHSFKPIEITKPNKNHWTRNLI